MAGAVGRVEDLVVEDREVQGQAKADGVSRGELALRDVGGDLYAFVQPLHQPTILRGTGEMYMK